MARQVSINILQTLQNLLGMYKYPDEEVLVLEAMANGIDAGAKSIRITFDRDGGGNYVTFENDGAPMSEGAFRDYHTISSSTKTKGRGIGFAGVGAKIFMAAWEQAEIVTVTGRRRRVMASRMFRRGEEVEYESTLDGTPIDDITGGRRADHASGTSYRVRLDGIRYKSLREEIVHIVQFWFNYALVSKRLAVTVDGIRIDPWKPAGSMFRKEITYDRHRIRCYAWHADRPVPTYLRHITYYVYGKRIACERVEWESDIRENDRVFCMADVSLIADHLTSSKESFKKSREASGAKNAAKRVFRKILEENGQIRIQQSVAPSVTKEVINEFTKKLDDILNLPDFKFLNPLSRLGMRDVTVRDRDGPEVGGSGGEDVGGTPNEPGEDSRERNEDSHEQGKDPGPEDVREVIADDGGKGGGDSGRKKKKAGGLRIIVEDYPDDGREGWVDVVNRAVVYNTGHPFAARAAEGPIEMERYNTARVIISSLIKSKNDQTEMDAKKTLEYMERILHMTYGIDE